MDGGLLKIWWAVRVKCVFHVGGICKWEGSIIDMNAHLKSVQEHFSWTESKIKDYEAKIRELECIVESLKGTVSSTADTSPIRLCRDAKNEAV
ncbi:MAG: hypothetical protein KVP17_004563 [Porospora cf. gigantea B]|uniref:uncharacterized protein n=1 Tax=Porospora cf. gigantea B TaxID=2853592 RepID=UPI003571C804|nr:MAG: hypothetical protein KVP17_004563 [Porospora cf. gigantea B]